MLDYIRIGCAVPKVQVGNVEKNTQDICAIMKQAEEKKVDLLVFPELALTGYSCQDLFFQQALQKGVLDAMPKLLACSAQYPAVTCVVGMPIAVDGLVYNCAAVIAQGEVKGLVPKTFLPNYGGFAEKRWFAAASDLQRDRVQARELGIDGWYSIPVGGNFAFRIGEYTVGVELCEDLWAPVQPSAMLAMAGAEVIVNPAASNALPGKREERKNAVLRQSAACSCVYAFCSAGSTESTQDTVFSGHSLIAQNGTLLAENEKNIDTDYLMVMDADLGIVRTQRSRNTTFRDAAAAFGGGVETVICDAEPLRGDGSLHPVSKLPFVPQTKQERKTLCHCVFDIQAEGLKHRLETIGAKAVIGISGGLDSTLALLVTVEAMRRLGRPMTDIYGITMPCFGTSDRTYNNAWELMKTLGISTKEVNIREAVSQHFRDIGHDPQIHDTTYENAQARERTQILMDHAGEVGGIVIGTGDLSELALGWCTYNGDHMSMYSVNGSVPKTLIRWIIETVAERETFAPAKAVLEDILDTPISPELLPPDAQGKISQQTEDIVGPYALHDFFLYHMVKHGFDPEKIYTLACRAFREDFDGKTVKKWLQTFCRRFFTQQFKRSCQPDGIKATELDLSIRGDWRMPSDAAAKLWLSQIEKL